MKNTLLFQCQAEPQAARKRPQIASLECVLSEKNVVASLGLGGGGGGGGGGKGNIIE